MKRKVGALWGKVRIYEQHWNSINPNGEVEDDLLKDLLDKSYYLVLGGFSKKKQKEILESGDAKNGI